MWYPFYWLLYWLTKPIRTLMWWYDDFDFCVMLLWRNPYQREFIFAQSKFETGDWSSGLCQKYNNYFAMGYVAASKYQDGKIAYSGANPQLEPQYFATFSGVHRSVYDYYVFLRDRAKTLGKAMDKAPDAEFVLDSQENYAWLSWIVGCYAGYGYFLGNVDNYINGIRKYAWGFEDRKIAFWFNLIASIILWTWIARFIFSSSYRARVLGKAKKAYQGTKDKVKRAATYAVAKG